MLKVEEFSINCLIQIKKSHVLSSLKEVTKVLFILIVSEFWLIGGSWQGKLMMWTNPSDYNNYNLNAKCRIGHKDDILTIDSSSQYIVSGGVDGLLSIWNSFSGVLKYSVTLPIPTVSQSE